MKKKLLAFTVLTITVCFFSLKTVAQSDAGGQTGGGPAPVANLVIDLGEAGTVEIAPASPYFSLVKSLLKYLNATVAQDGVVTFPNNSSYSGCVSSLYYARCISYTTYKNACRPPSSSGCR